jgi:ferric-dicitrate binding protein FerR (iron transport regulator)
MKDLILKFCKGNYSKEEFQRIKAFFQDKESADSLEEHLQSHWNECKDSSIGDEAEFDRILNNVLHVVNAEPKKLLKVERLTFAKRFFTGFSHVAAVLVIPLLVSLFLFLRHDKPDQTLFADNVVKVSRGVVSYLHLPDGTQVWLNSGSRLSYSNSFNKENRNVTLEGEAYFEVTKNTKKPFIVRGKEVAVKVLGTKFNVKSYNEDASVAVTLLEGSVHLSDITNLASSLVLKPNEQATFIKENNIITNKKVNAENACEWIHGNLIFDDEEFGQIAKCLERQYNITINIQDREIEQLHFYGKFKNSQPIDEILNIMTANQKFHYDQKENVITLSKN